MAVPRGGRLYLEFWVSFLFPVSSLQILKLRTASPKDPACRALKPGDARLWSLKLEASGNW